ncbi:MAG TPA: GspMb/PilO family protein [Planctomycetota bacterium]|jgi:Tfp pilus assembly protein PilO
MNLSKREKWLTFGVLGVVGLLLADRYVLAPLLDEQGLLETQREQILSDISRSRKLVSERKQLREKWKDMVASGLKGSPAEAESQLLHALRDWARNAGFSLASVKPERPESKASLREVHVQASGTGTMDGVARFLCQAQAAQFPLKVTELQIGSRTSGINDLTLDLKLSTLYTAAEQKPEKAKAGGVVQ